MSNQKDIEQYRLKIKKLKHKIENENNMKEQLQTKGLKMSRLMQSIIVQQMSLESVMRKLETLLRQKGLSLKDLFRCCDSQYKSVITIQSYVNLIKNLGIKLSRQQYEYINNFLMPDQQIKQEEYNQLLKQIR